MGAVVNPPPAAEAHLAISADVVVSATARPGVVCTRRPGEAQACFEAPAGAPRSVALGRWMQTVVVVLEVADGAGWSWHYHLGGGEFDIGWAEILRTDVPLRLAGIDNPEGDSLQLLLTEVTRPVRGWLWFDPCPGAPAIAEMQRIGGAP